MYRHNKFDFFFRKKEEQISKERKKERDREKERQRKRDIQRELIKFKTIPYY